MLDLDAFRLGEEGAVGLVEGGGRGGGGEAEDEVGEGDCWEGGDLC